MKSVAKTIHSVCFLISFGSHPSFKIGISFVDGTFSKHYDLKLSSGDTLRVVRRGPYTEGQFVGSWIACDIRILKLHQTGKFPVMLAAGTGGGGYCEMKWNKLIQRQSQQILVGKLLYSFDGGNSFVDPRKLAENIPGTKSYGCQRFSLDGKGLRVQYWKTCFDTYMKDPLSFTSSDGGKSWQDEREPTVTKTDV